MGDDQNDVIVGIQRQLEHSLLRTGWQAAPDSLRFIALVCPAGMPHSQGSPMTPSDVHQPPTAVGSSGKRHLSVRWRLLLLLVLIPVISSGGALIWLETLEAAVYELDRDPTDLDGPPKEYRWEVPPPVIVCPNSMVFREQIEAAMRFWEERGHRFGELFFHRDPSALCFAPRPGGHIVIRAATAEVKNEMAADTLAETRFNTTGYEGSLAYAKLFMVVAPQERVLEHELGHALGFSHYNVAGHLMHGRVPVGGWDDFGLKDMSPEAREEWEETVGSRKEGR